MTLNQGRHMLAIPGPSVMPDRVLQAMHRPAPNIYTGELVEITESLVPDLKAVARTEGHVAMYIGNGHAAWEASLANTHSRGDLTLVAVTGRFAHGWAISAQGLGIETEFMEFGPTTPIDPAAVEERLKADKEHKIKSVLAVHTDTSTSVRSDIAALRKAIDAAGHPALLMVDCMASLGCDRFEMDAWGADVMTAGCQKGLMTPPGMAFVFFNDKAKAARETANCVTGYWDWTDRVNPPFYYAFWLGTAPTHHIYGLREALDMIKEEGIEQIWARHESIAKGLWAACETWEQGGMFSMNVPERNHRSCAVTTLKLPSPKDEELRSFLEHKLGVTLGIGLGMTIDNSPQSESTFRIGHMGHLTAHQMLGTIGSVETGLRALQIPIGEGAVEAAAMVYAAA